MRGGRLPDPGLAALCATCREPREAHGGPKHYGACPGRSGLHADRFRLQEVDKPAEITVRQITHVMPVSRELLEDRLPPWDEIERQMEANAAAFAALPAEEQARILAEREAKYEAERCTVCGCHPDEHGG